MAMVTCRTLMIVPICVFLFTACHRQGVPAGAPSAGATASGTGSQRFTRLFDGKTLSGWLEVPADSWRVKDGAMASLGAGRGFIYTMRDFSNYRLMFTARHISGVPRHDHQMCFLIFGTRPPAGQKPLDALGGIQFQPPNGGHWDYRPGHNNAGNSEFTKLPHADFVPSEWFGVEVLVSATAGIARMAVAQPVGSPAVEVLDFILPEAAKTGPIAFQMHNAGLIDEYKDVRIQANPTDLGLITVAATQPQTRTH